MRTSRLKTERDPNTLVAIILFCILIIVLAVMWGYSSLSDNAYHKALEKVCADFNGTLSTVDYGSVQCAVVTNETVRFLTIEIRKL